MHCNASKFGTANAQMFAVPHFFVLVLNIAMHLVQILLPRYDNEGNAFAKEAFDHVRNELTERFGGVTAWLRATAEGVWLTDDGSTSHDRIVIFEVMVDMLDRGWWADYRAELQLRFRQEQLIVRAQTIEPL